ncbi:MAG: hypothetical protein R2867_29090 [Caldilineaceae bacterium]
MNISELSLALSQLTSYIDQQRFAEYWRAGLQVFSEQLAAQSARIFLLSEQTLAGSEAFCIGETPALCAEYLTAGAGAFCQR